MSSTTTGTKTVASLARTGRSPCPARCDAREGLRHLAGIQLGTDLGPDRDRRPRPARHRPRGGDRVAIHSEDNPEWIILDLATVAVRGITVGLYPTNPSAEVEYLVGDCTPKVYFAEDQEQADKVLEIDPEVAARSSASSTPSRGFGDYTDERLMFWDDFLELGRQHREANPGAVEKLMSEATPTTS